MTVATHAPRFEGRHVPPVARRTLPACIRRWLRAALAMLVLWIGAGLCAPLCFGAGWATFAVDDSMSQVQAPAAPLRWRTPLPSKSESNLLDAAVQVRIVLNTSPWVGKQARIFMVMPPLPQSSLSVQWMTGGILQPGRLTGGQRQLVYQGIVPGPRIEDTMRVAVVADARDPVTPQRVNFTFEIEVPSR
jgi:hypothetical protein